MSIRESLLKKCWPWIEWIGLAPYLRQGYFTLQAAPRGWTRRTHIGGASAELATTTWFEYKRVKHFHGEEDVLADLLSVLDDDVVFWDVGANVGIYSCLVADAAPAGVVVGFEPEPNNLARLRANLSSNDPACEWTTSGIALSDCDTCRRLAAGYPEDVREVGAGHYYLSESGGPRVNCRRADTLIEQGYPAPDTVKIDVQGAELDVLRGFGDALGDVETAYVELHTEKADRYDATTEETEQYLRDAGFTLAHIGEPSGSRDGVYHVRATR